MRAKERNNQMILKKLNQQEKNIATKTKEYGMIPHIWILEYLNILINQ